MIELEPKLEASKNWWDEVTPVIDVLKSFDSQELTAQAVVRGRTVAIRDHKNLTFADLRDQTGKIQLVVSKKDNFSDLLLQDGDLIAAHGTTIKTRTGEPSLKLDEIKIFNSPIDLVESNHNLSIIGNREKLELLRQISMFNSNLRRGLIERGFLEFQTQVLRETYEAGTARPFVTWQNSSEKNVYLRLTMETDLRKLQAAGFEKVFELGKSFRNEGKDRNHLPEFSLLEAYSAYTDLPVSLQLFGGLLDNAMIELSKEMPIQNPNMFHRWKVLSYLEIEPQIIEIISRDQSARPMEQKIMTAIKKEVAPSIQKPTFLINLPSRMSPFAKRSDNNPSCSQRAWAIANGRTFCDIYEDETNPSVLEENLKWQDDNLMRGQHISHISNELLALSKIGLPPSSSFGLSLNRLYAIINNFEDVRTTELFEI